MRRLITTLGLIVAPHPAVQRQRACSPLRSATNRRMLQNHSLENSGQ